MIFFPIRAHLFDHDAAEVAMLKGAERRVLLGQDVGELNVELIQLRDLLQSEVCLAGPVSGDIPGLWCALNREVCII